MRRACSTCSVEKTLTPSSIQGAVTNVYRTVSNSVIELTWSKARPGPSLSISVNNCPIPITLQRGSFSCLIHKTSIVGICYDFSAAKYGLGPEPVSDYYVAVVIDKEFALLVGDRSRDFVKGFGDGSYREGEFWMVSRKVQVVGRAMYSTRARFYEEGREHEIVVRFEGEVEMGVYVDERKVVGVRRLRWNFRGKETVFVDGLAVDVMWDLFRWLFHEGGSGGGGAVVLFQTRSPAKSRLWMEEEEEESGGGFSLLVQICL